MKPRILLAQLSVCAHDATTQVTGKAPSLQPTIPTNGPFRALVVYVRFNDDTFGSGCPPSNLEWANRDVLPVIASTILSPTATPAAPPNPPFPENSLTYYYYQQSNQRLILYGEVFNEVVVVQNQSTYNITGTTSTSTNGMADLTTDVVNYITDPARGINQIDFRDFDENGDGYFDHLFIITRRFDPILPRPAWSGFAILGNNARPELTNNGISLDWDRSGSFTRYDDAGNIFAEINHMRLVAHEFGHNIWRANLLGGAHIQNIGGTSGVPANGSTQIGYALMVGGGSGIDTRGDETISAFERDIINDDWIDCPVVSISGTLTLNDLVSSNTTNCNQLVVPIGGTTTRSVYLSNRQRVDHYDILRTNTCTVPTNKQGLKTSGLLVTMREDNTSDNDFAVIAADNTLDFSIEATPYSGDMFDPGSSGMLQKQLTPWTRPNISGYSEYPTTFTMQAGNWQAVDNIRYTGGADNQMAVDYMADFRAGPLVREDSFIGDESSGITITGDMVVQDDATVLIEDGVTLNFTTGVTIDVESTASLLATGTAAAPVQLNGGILDISSTDSDFWNTEFNTEEIIIRNGATVNFYADNSIVIGPGFKAELGSEFSALTGTGIPAPPSSALGPFPELYVESDLSNNSSNSDENEASTSPTPLNSIPIAAAEIFPNPSNSTITIRYRLEQEGYISLKIYNMIGQEVKTLVSKYQSIGNWESIWDGRDSSGSRVPSGTYIYRIESNEQTQTGQLILIK